MSDSADSAMRAHIQEGSVFYFDDETLSSPEPHYFIILNYNPKTDKSLILVCASTQSFAVKLRNIDCDPNNTLVEVTPEKCTFLKKVSIFDCNHPFEKHIEELVDKLRKKKLQFRGVASTSIVEKLRAAVIASRLVSKGCKKTLTKEADIKKNIPATK